MLDALIHYMRIVNYGLIILAVIVNFLLGLLYFRNAVERHDSDMAGAIFIGLYAIILAFLPNDYFLWNYLANG